jgi:hypothetical protein
MTQKDPDTLMQHIERAQRAGAVEILSWDCKCVPTSHHMEWDMMFKLVFKTGKKMSLRTADILSIHISLNYPNHKIHNLQIEDLSKVLISYSIK